jgi:rhomboid protease GluP
LGEDEGGGLLDELVELLARAMDAVGLNGRRLRWKWNQRKKQMAEQKEEASVMLRSARGSHKMCPSCRALVPRSAKACSECGASLSGVTSPGFGRVLTQIFPGATAATSLILLTNGFWFAMMLMAQMKTGEGGGLGLFRAFDGRLLYRFGSGYGIAIIYGEWWRLITPIFLHGGILHFGFNSYVLLQLGPLVEAEYGRDRFWIVYLLCGIAGNVLAALFVPGIPVVGASGAIFGLVGLLIVHSGRRGGFGGRQLRSRLIQWAFLMFVISLMPGISLSAHAGGFLGGLALGWLVPAGEIRNRTAARVWEVLAVVCVLLVVFSFYRIAVHGSP